MTYKLNFNITRNTTGGEDVTSCADPEVPATVNKTGFVCSLCKRPQVCMADTMYPFASLLYSEFPFKFYIKPIPQLGTQQVNFSVVYDTMWGDVSLEAPAYAKGPFFITIGWTEPLQNLLAIRPTFGS